MARKPTHTDGTVESKDKADAAASEANRNEGISPDLRSTTRRGRFQMGVGLAAISGLPGSIAATAVAAEAIPICRRRRTSSC